MVMRIGLISMAHVHAEGYASELEKRGLLSGIYDEDEKRGKNAAEKHNVKFFSEVDSLLDSSDAVLIASPTNLHRIYVERVASRHKHILIEKPLAFRRDEAEAMVKSASEVKFGICFSSRLSPVYITAKRILNEGALGHVNFMRIRVAHSAALDKWFAPDNWFVDRVRSGGGGLLDLGVHGVDLLYWLKGEPPASTAALTSNASGTYGIDDEGALIMKWRDGALGEVEGAWTQRAGFNSLEVYGNLGTLVTGLPGHTLLVNRKGEWEDVAVTVAQKTVIEDFVESIEQNREPVAPAKDGIISAAVMEAAYSNSGTELKL